MLSGPMIRPIASSVMLVRWRGEGLRDSGDSWGEGDDDFTKLLVSDFGVAAVIGDSESLKSLALTPWLRELWSTPLCPVPLALSLGSISVCYC